MAKKPRKPQLKVVFDTNVLFTEVASDLIRAEAVKLISDNAGHSDLEISWYLPRIVRCEREYQMIDRAMKLLPSLAKLEKVLGHSLAINAEIVNERIRSAIERQMAALTLSDLELDELAVDWKRLSQDAVFRRPPFDPGEKEKGFRDALIAETFIQLVEKSARTAAVCRLVIVSGDGLLASSIRQRTGDRTNVIVIPSVEDLGALINTLVSKVSEEFVNKLQSVAAPYFYDFVKNEGLYAKWDIDQVIRGQYSKELDALPADAQHRETLSPWNLSPPRFIKKDRKRVHWTSRVTVNSQLYRIEEKQPMTGGAFGFGSTEPNVQGAFAGTGGALYPPLPTGALSLGQLIGQTSKVRVPYKKGKTHFDVSWSATISQSKKLTNPSLEGIAFVETAWE